MPRKRQGRQKPTQSYILRYKTSRGPEAVALYNQTGRTAAKWQESLLKDILGLDKNGLWVHSKFGYSVPRRNGKNKILAIREMSEKSEPAFPEIKNKLGQYNNHRLS